MNKMKNVVDRSEYALLAEQKRVLRYLRAHHFLFALLTATGVILFWRGIWEGADLVPYLRHPGVSIAIGLVILLASGVFVVEFLGNYIIQRQGSVMQELERIQLRKEAEIKEDLVEEEASKDKSKTKK